MFAATLDPFAQSFQLPRSTSAMLCSRWVGRYSLLLLVLARMRARQLLTFLLLNYGHRDVFTRSDTDLIMNTLLFVNCIRPWAVPRPDSHGGGPKIVWPGAPIVQIDVPCLRSSGAVLPHCLRAPAHRYAGRSQSRGSFFGGVLLFLLLLLILAIIIILLV